MRYTIFCLCFQVHKSFFLVHLSSRASLCFWHFFTLHYKMVERMILWRRRAILYVFVCTIDRNAFSLINGNTYIHICATQRTNVPCIYTDFLPVYISLEETYSPRTPPQSVRDNCSCCLKAHLLVRYDCFVNCMKQFG